MTASRPATCTSISGCRSSRITGATAALTRKGSPRHIRAGRRYYRAITVVFVTATVLAAMRWRQDYYLFLIGAVAFTAATIGYQHRRRHRPGDTGHIAGMGTAYVAMLTAFYVDNGPHLPLWDHLPRLTFWLLPSAIGAPIISRAIIRAQRARRSRNLPPGQLAGRAAWMMAECSPVPAGWVLAMVMPVNPAARSRSRYWA